jgi:hypothetical protein
MTDVANIFWTVVVCLPLGFGAGYYVKGRGLTGVETDLGNAKTTVTTDVKSL